MIKIFCVEDDSNIRELICCALRSGGYCATGLEDGLFLFDALKNERPDLILLDIMLPKMSGIEILKMLKTDMLFRSIPVIMLSAKSSEIDKVTGLETGADDYITKPFGVMEFLSRVKAVLRRSEASPTDNTKPLTFQTISIDPLRRTVSANGQEITTTYKEFELLQYLMQNLGLVLSRNTLMEKVWGFDYEGESRTVDMHIKTLRQKLGEQGNLIKTIRGVGYKFGE